MENSILKKMSFYVKKLLVNTFTKYFHISLYQLTHEKAKRRSGKAKKEVSLMGSLIKEWLVLQISVAGAVILYWSGWSGNAVKFWTSWTVGICGLLLIAAGVYWHHRLMKKH